MQGSCCDNVFKQNNLYEENQTQPREVFVLQAYRIKKTQKMCSILLTHSMFCHRLEDWDVRLGRLGGRTHGKLNGFEWTRTHSAQIPNESFILQPYMQLHRNVPKLLFSISQSRCMPQVRSRLQRHVHGCARSNSCCGWDYVNLVAVPYGIYTRIYDSIKRHHDRL